MSDQLVTAVVTVFTAIIGVAILAVLVSRNSQTSTVIKAASGGFAQDLAAALSPISGQCSIQWAQKTRRIILPRRLCLQCSRSSISAVTVATLGQHQTRFSDHNFTAKLPTWRRVWVGLSVGKLSINP
jgi:hypothetical protein